MGVGGRRGEEAAAGARARPGARPPARCCSATPLLHPPLGGAGASALRAAAASCPALGQAPA